MGWKFGVAAPGKTVHSDVESRGALSHEAGAKQDLDLVIDAA